MDENNLGLIGDPVMSKIKKHKASVYPQPRIEKYEKSKPKETPLGNTAQAVEHRVGFFKWKLRVPCDFDRMGADEI